MRLILGIICGLAAGAGFAAAEYFAIRPGAGFFDSQPVFVAALPYTWTMLKLTGESNFTSDSASQVAAAAAVDIGLAFIAGFLVQTAARVCWRGLKRARGRA